MKNLTNDQILEGINSNFSDTLNFNISTYLTDFYIFAVKDVKNNLI